MKRSVPVIHCCQCAKARTNDLRLHKIVSKVCFYTVVPLKHATITAHYICVECCGLSEHITEIYNDTATASNYILYMVKQQLHLSSTYTVFHILLNNYNITEKFTLNWHTIKVILVSW